MKPYITSNYKDNGKKSERKKLGRCYFRPKGSGAWDCIKGKRGIAYYEDHGYGTSSYVFVPDKNPFPGSLYIVNKSELEMIDDF